MNYSLLKYCFQDKESLFSQFKARKQVLDAEYPYARRIFIDNNASVLFVAHLDTVLPPKIHSITDTRIVAQGLDDRLGLYFILTLLQAGIKADILLTDLEEQYLSTAKHHICKKYNWIVEFDRGGVDVVTYDSYCPSLNMEIIKYWDIGQGAFSDVCFLDTPSAYFNVGVGYYKSHLADSYVNIVDIYTQLNKFLHFYKQNKAIAYQQEYNGEFDTLVCEFCGYPFEFYTGGNNKLCKECLD